MDMKKEKQSTEEILFRLGFISIVILVLALCVVRSFPEFFSKILIPCPFYVLMGYYCPGCGGTRAIRYFLTGHFFKSLRYHPLIPYIGVGGTVFMVTHTLERITKGRIKGIKFRNWYVYIMGGILVLQFVIKNGLVYFWGYHVI